MKKIFFYRALSALFVGGMVFSAVSCADDELGENTNNGDTEAAVRFDVSDSQEDAQTRGALTRGAITPGLADKDLDGKKLAVQSSENLDVCLIETTVEGVNPVKLEPGTRANITTLEKLTDFSSTGVRGTAANAINKEWFNEEKTRNNGILYNAKSWSWLQPHGRFYAVYPESTNSSNGIKFTKPNGTAAPSIEFTVNTDVRKQVDLMTACSGNVQYATRFQAPRTNLQFRHALTAIRFAVGQNLSFNKTIKDITLKNVLIKSKYTLSNNLNGAGAAWDHSGYNTRGNVTLSNVNYNTNENPNSIVRNRSQYVNSNVTDLTQLRDNYTFYMIPQDLDNKVTAEVEFTDGSKITVPLKGSWKAGTTRTYKLSQKNSSWVYTLNEISPSAVAYDKTQATYQIESYRQAPDGTKQAVAWKVIGYSVDNGTSWTTTKPSWLKSLSKEQGDGGATAEQLTATLGTDIVDLAAERNKTLQNAAPLGTATAPYNLSNATGAAAVQNTANCYVISAPGHYMIPLVYGNAIKNGGTNRSAYATSSLPVTNVGTALNPLVDHNGKSITDPWIEKTNGKANNGINTAQVTWADEKDLVMLSGTPIYRDASGNAFVKFEVKKENIKSGNAVISVKKGSTTLWSWHLWFAPKNALDKIAVTNKQGSTYEFTNEALGWKPTAWQGTPYQSPRTIKVKVKQTIGEKQEAVITITQLPGTTSRTGYTTQYQWGRKDAFPGKSGQPAQGTINWNAGSNMYMQTIIQNPQNYYTAGYNRDGSLNAEAWFAKYYTFYNLWSMNQKDKVSMNQANSQTVVKTIYDPSPVGFSVPANDAFTGFTENGLNGGRMNVNGTDNAQTYNNNFGHNFWTNSSKTETIFFPATGYREAKDGNIVSYYGNYGDYWTATPTDMNNGSVMGFDVSSVHPLFRNIRAFGFAVRPAAEK
ncbi:fimbrillin family protein [Prevotella melaninogenica]|uniref:fimbrillin family protein n=2 Tax=Prevotella melaninogenica TaxID=28132 RepID=UPI001C60A97A|nr:fimbrillin family protein [Prevotella melaninogenica]MBW4896845.1 fimbrillin family protein [Prevotella melaninogenica]